MFKLMLSLSIIVIAGCASTTQEQDEYYGSGYINVSEASWTLDNKGTYPFTATKGEISCASHPVKGREVYFAPEGFTDEDYIGTPLNQPAILSLEQANMSPNVPYMIKKGANLSEAIKIGLQVCDEMQDALKN